MAAVTQETGLMEPPRLLHIHEHVGHRRARPRPNLFTKHNVRSSVNFSGLLKNATRWFCGSTSARAQ